MSTNKQTMRQLAVDAKELAIIKRYTKGIEAQKKFIAAATPATVLALLDELEAKDKAWSAHDNHINQQADRIESLEQKNGELGRALGAAERRIAELEARSVKLPMAYDINVAGERVEHKLGDHFDSDEIIAAICVAGITVKGDSE